MQGRVLTISRSNSPFLIGSGGEGLRAGVHVYTDSGAEGAVLERTGAEKGVAVALTDSRGKPTRWTDEERLGALWLRQSALAIAPERSAENLVAQRNGSWAAAKEELLASLAAPTMADLVRRIEAGSLTAVQRKELNKIRASTDPRDRVRAYSLLRTVGQSRPGDPRGSIDGPGQGDVQPTVRGALAGVAEDVRAALPEPPRPSISSTTAAAAVGLAVLLFYSRR